jgi:hypothetical protein
MIVDGGRDFLGKCESLPSKMGVRIDKTFPIGRAMRKVLSISIWDEDGIGVYLALKGG